MTLQRMEGSGNFLNLGKSHEEPILPADKFITPPSTDGTSHFYSMYCKDHPSSVHLLANAVPSILRLT